PLPPLPSTAFPNQQHQQSQSLFTDFDLLSPSLIKPIFHSTDTHSLIQFYSSFAHTNSNINNNNSNTINRMSSSSSSSITHIPTRPPVAKTRLPIYHVPQVTAPAPIRPKEITSMIAPTNPTGSIRPTMSITNRPPPPTTMQTRFGFIPRPSVPSGQQVRTSTFATRSRSISPTSTASANSSSSLHAPQQLSKTQTLTKTTPTRTKPSSPPIANDTPKHKLIVSPRPRESSATRSIARPTSQVSTSANQLRSRTPSRTSTTSLTSSAASTVPSLSIPTSVQPTTTINSTAKNDVNAIRDRYRVQQRMNFFTRRTPVSTANGSPIAGSVKTAEPLNTNKDKKQSVPPSKLSPANNSTNDSKAATPPQSVSPQGNSMYTKGSSSSNHPPSTHLSQSGKHRQRAISMLSSSSAISNVLNQDVLLEDDNCSLKSEDLMCDYDDTLTLDSLSKNLSERTDSCSSTSLTNEPNKKHSSVISTTSTKPNILVNQSISKEHRSSALVNGSTAMNDKINGNLRDTLDELNRLNNRLENGLDHENNRRIPTRSFSLKPPPSYLPPLEDAEQITMDVESYRQVMKDVMVVKTVLHQLDRLLKHSDGANMTDSMMGSFHEFHESVCNSRRYSSSTEGTIRSSIDENSSYDDLLKEIIALRKEKEQDKQTIKLLQEQMYKYSSQTNN
ncbi:unnamed protein product, partial [Adineta ricciae]